MNQLHNLTLTDWTHWCYCIVMSLWVRVMIILSWFILHYDCTVHFPYILPFLMALGYLVFLSCIKCQTSQNRNIKNILRPRRHLLTYSFQTCMTFIEKKKKLHSLSLLCSKKEQIIIIKVCCLMIALCGEQTEIWIGSQFTFFVQKRAAWTL